MAQTLTLAIGDDAVALTTDGQTVTEVVLRGPNISAWPAFELTDLAELAHKFNGSAVIAVNGNGRDGGSGGNKAKAVKAAVKAVKATPKVKAPAEATDAQERVYRKLTPELEEQIVAAWTEQPNISALAVSFNVPRHTMQAWVGRLRKAGKVSAPVKAA